MNLKNLIQETRENYINAMINLLKSIKSPKILLWFSVRTPEQLEEVSLYKLAIKRTFNQNTLFKRFSNELGIFRRYLNNNYLLGEFPQLVNRDMVEQIKQHSDFYIDCVTNIGMPQILVDFQGKVVGKNSYYPSPQMHQQAAKVLYPVCKNILESKS